MLCQIADAPCSPHLAWHVRTLCGSCHRFLGASQPKPERSLALGGHSSRQPDASRLSSVAASDRKPRNATCASWPRYSDCGGSSSSSGEGGGSSSSGGDTNSSSRQYPLTFMVEAFEMG